MPTQSDVEYVPRIEYDQKMKSIDQKFDEFTETMLGQFDRMYTYMDGRFDAIDRRLNDHELRFNRIDENLAVLNNNVGLIIRHLGIPEAQAAI